LDTLAAHHSVCALVGASAAVEAAAADQSPPPARIVRSGALETGLDWIWVLLDEAVVPRPGALAALLQARERAAALPEPAARFPDPVLFAGVVVDERGRVDEARGAWYRRNHIDLTMGSTGERLLPIRAAAGPVLVHRRALERAEIPSATPAGVLEWTAHVLRDEIGFLVPDSESVALAPADDPLGDPRTVARLVRGGALGRLDVARAAHELVERFRPRGRGTRPALR
jgi:hypothetical protein